MKESTRNAPRQSILFSFCDIGSVDTVELGGCIVGSEIIPSINAINPAGALKGQ